MYLFNKGLDDFRAPLEELLVVLRNSQKESAAALGYVALIMCSLYSYLLNMEGFLVSYFLLFWIGKNSLLKRDYFKTKKSKEYQDIKIMYKGINVLKIQQ